MKGNVTLEYLEGKFKGEGFERFRKIAELGGYGTPAKDHTGGLDPNYRGGLDIKGALDPENKALTDAKKRQILELMGEDPEAAAETVAAAKEEAKAAEVVEVGTAGIKKRGAK